MTWPPEWIDALLLARSQDPPRSYARIARDLGVTRGAVAGQWSRQRHRGPSQRKGRIPHRWTEKLLTERWADRKRARAGS